ncbi:non-ribosomal peptide synthetase [Chromobacterium sp. ATCC 53434]|nr:non-ribosomal peptide synthetase [Chromobacterium sp. ATCC 53434]
MANIQDIYPLAPLQEGILFHHLLGGEGDAYLLSSLMAFDSGERLQGFVAALQQVVARHDILRTAIQWQGLPEPVQVVWRDAPVTVETVELDPADGPLAAQLEQRYDPRRTRLDVARAPLLCGYAAADPADGRHYLQLLFHHLVVDHTSLDILMGEIQDIQAGLGAALPPSLPFRNFVAQARLGVSAAEHEAYFRAELGEVDEPTAAFGLQGNRGDGDGLDESRLRLPAELTDRLRRQARRLGVSVASLAHLAWGRVLARASGRDTVVFGTVLFGRLQGGAGADRALGLFINTLPLKLAFGDASVEQAARRTQQALTRLLRHEHASLALAQRCSGVAAPQPLFSSVLNYRYGEEVGAGSGLEGIAEMAGEERTNYPLTLSVDDFGDAGLALKAQVSATVGAARICALMERTLAALADALEAGGGMPARALEVLPDAEKRLLLDDFNAASTPYPDDLLIHQLFEAQAAARPDAPALLYGDETLSYGELNRRANRLAHRLIALGVGPGQRVGLCLARSVDIVAALLAVLKAGGTYVPLDPSYPPERLAYMLEDSAPTAVLTQASLRALCADGDWAVALLDEEAEHLAALPAENPVVAGLGSRHPAYVIYTSGSTGRPKGVVCAHYGVVHLMRSLSGVWPMTPDSRVLQFASFSFDASVWEYAGALSSGAALCLATREERMPGQALQDTLRRFGISHTLLPSSALKMMDPAAIGYRVENLLVGGEACPVALAEAWAAEHRLFNVYGPTESTVYATYHRCLTDQAGVLPIGRPLPNIRAYILDVDLQPAPLGVAGELHIGGPGVTDGYLNRPELTAQRFVADPFGGVAGARLYKTGDLGRWLADGSIEYLGRNDFQVKIRGFRIELGEIEARLAACAGVTEAVVLAREDASGDKRLVAYLTAGPGAALEAAVLRAELARDLAEYMIPSAFVVLEAFPLTPNGKLDRKALPAPDGALQSSREYEAPQGETETALAAIWSALLGVERIGRRDNFFELGGHSLLAVSMVARAARQLGASLALRQVYQAADLRTLAEMAGRDADADADGAVALRGGDGVPLFLLHEVYGGIAYAQNLAGHLAGCFPIYALPAGDWGRDRREGGIRELAIVHIERIRRIQPRGPYRLAGWSVGGSIAHAMAALLQEQGEAVSFLGLIDSCGDYAPQRRMLENRLARERDQDIGLLFLMLEMELGLDEAALDRLRAMPDIDSMITATLSRTDWGKGLTMDEVKAMLATQAAIFRSAVGYRPRPLATRPVLYGASVSLAQRLDQPWRELQGEALSVRPIPGDHHSILEKPAIAELATEMSRSLISP